MTNMATLRFECTNSHGVTTLRLQGKRGPVDLPVQGQHVWVPYPLVRQMMRTHGGWAISDPGACWPPRRGLLSPPEPLAPGDTVRFPDGTQLVVPAPFNQAIEIPDRFVEHFVAKGWHRLAPYA